MAYGRDRLAVVLAQRRPFAVKDACRTMIARVPGRELVGNVKHEFCRITLCAERVAYEFQRGLVTDAADDEEQFFLRAVVDVQRGRTHAGACRNIACRGPVESQIAKCVQSCEQEVPRCTDCNGTPHVVGFNAWFSERFACHFGFLPNGHLASQISQTLSRHNSHLWPGSGLDHTAGSRPQMHRRSQLAVASRPSSRACAGVCHFRVSRGRVLSLRATVSQSSRVSDRRSAPLGQYWRSKPLMFSFEPPCHGECGSQKNTASPVSTVNCAC